MAHDFAFTIGGAERVSALLALEVATERPLVTLGGRPEIFAELGVDEVEVRHPRLFAERYYRQASLLFPLLASMARPVPGNVVASSYAFSHHLRGTGQTVVYCHSPLRQVWSGSSMYSGTMPAPARLALRAATSPLRRSDHAAANRADTYVANSKAVAQRIRRFYGIEPAAVVYPPFDDKFRPAPIPRGDHYLWVGRIVEPYKRLEPLLEAFRASPHRRLVVAGDGRDGPRLRASAPPNVSFVGAADTDALAAGYQAARAVIFPSEDDFGLVPVEAMACGTPVLALGRGGALETVVEGRTGVLFPESTPREIGAALDRFEASTWDHDEIQEYARSHFGRDEFVRAMRAVLADVERAG
ncbi:glycosyltransferase [Cellulomonas sp. ATA003]|uniref:glycosyltransferase n=1 Tax=Cellulomonas sp. ATA003 TaxID=3073064 RepID=UPI0028739D89|nr:glycosyltransferase [Cellulomonas sp. ATA003]WNB85435.1 glycosyltransferase [Cellulomonas sp. ATA003]